MKITVNKQEIDTSATTLGQLAEELSLPMHGVAVAVDNQMVPRAKWEDCRLAAGASVIIIKAACGG